MSGLSESVQQQEAKAMRMLRSKKHQPSEIARITGLSQIWIEMKARGMGMKPLTVEGVDVTKEGVKNGN